jgi:two-component system, cell cycle sensor histidine kinase and response regulator CckA
MLLSGETELDHSTFIGLINNIALLLSLALFYNTTYYKWTVSRLLYYRLFNGLLLGVICILVMLNPWVITKGVIFDARSILISISGLFFGVIPAITTVIIASAYRFYLGGAGAWTGIAVITMSGAIGLAWRYFNRKNLDNLSWLNLYLMGITVHVAMLLLMLSLPGSIAINVIYRISLPVIILFPLGSAFLGRILIRKHEYIKMSEALRRSDSLLNEIQQISKVGGWEYNVETGRMFWTDEIYRIYEIPKDDRNPLDIGSGASFFSPEDHSIRNKALHMAITEGVPFDLTLRFHSAKGNVLWVRTIANVEKKNGKVVRVFGNIIDITESTLAKQALSESEERLKRALDNIPIIVMMYDPDMKIKYINSAVTRLSGRPVSDFIGKDEEEIWPPEVSKIFLRPLKEAIDTHEVRSINTAVQFPVIGKHYMINTYIPLLDDLGNVREIVGISNDYTDQQKLEEQFTQAQKMEAVGRLAGGIAHDFNNLLFIIIGYLDLLRDDINIDHPFHGQFEEIHKASMRAKELTKQLLAFSRKQVFETKIFSINEVISGFESLLRRVIGEDIELSLDLSDIPGFIDADIIQLEQVVMNLAVNAKDAMPDGGKLSIGTAVVQIDEIFAIQKNTVIPAGRYVMLSVSDNGIGMDAGILDKIFEPFFTTKETGIGTGLGLATVYGIIKQHGGYVRVYSEHGEGSVFKIYFPAVESGRKSNSTPSESKAKPLTQSAVILVAEDDPSVRKLLCRILTEEGYKVIESQNVEDAIKKAKEYTGEINLLITDVIMPLMNGTELHKKIAEFQPDIPVLYMSGYTRDVITRHGVLKEGIQFIQKPFSKQKLIEKITEIISPVK